MVSFSSVNGLFKIKKVTTNGEVLKIKPIKMILNHILKRLPNYLKGPKKGF